ncbi:MAG: zf-TFIIB domain-containing protein [Dehalococcoidia bacterium]
MVDSVSSMTCPRCYKQMLTIQEPDIKVEKCSGCAGIFWDEGELNVLATGMAGNIEFCSIDQDDHADEFPIISCPRCAERQMDKINLLAFSDLVFDFCRNCKGYFLDAGEIDQMNRILKELTSSRTEEEIREEIDGYLVRLDVRNNPNAAGRLVYLLASVYFRQPLGLGFRLFNEGWAAKLAKAFNIYPGQDFQTGNGLFDSEFIVQIVDIEKAHRLLSTEVQDNILKFANGPGGIFTIPGKISIYDTHITYSEGPYGNDLDYSHIPGSARPVLHSILEIAKLMETNL